MATFINILPMTKTDSSPEERNAGDFSAGTGNATGAFEEMMVNAMSPTSGQVQHHQQPQAPAQSIDSAPLANANGLGKYTPLNFATTTAPATVKSGPAKEKNSSAPVNTGSTAVNPSPEMLANQLLAMPPLAVSPIVNPAPAVVAGTSASPQTGNVKSIAVPLAVALISPVPAAISGMPSAQAGSVQSSAENAIKEIVSPIKSFEPNILPRASAASTGAMRTPSPGSSETQTTVSIPAPISEKLNSIAEKGAAQSAKDPAIPVSAEPAADKSELGAEAANSSSQSSSPVPATSQAQSESGGTSIAKQDMSMNQTGKTNKIAGQTEKILPGNGVSSPRANPSLPVSPNAQAYTAASTASAPVTANISAVSAEGTDSVAVTADTHMNPIERAQDMITVSAMRLSDSGNSSMQVVIKPDAGTQLSLELRQQGGEVQVQVVLQQGDFNQLNQQWPDLQQRLEEKGIHLAPLTDEGVAGNSSNGGNETLENKQNQATSVVPELTLVDAPAGIFAKDTAQAPVHQGWETWA